MVVRMIKRWPLCCSALVMVVVAVCAGMFMAEDFRATPMGMVVRIVAAGVALPGILSLLIAPARLLIGVFRKKLSYEEHADAALLVLVEFFFALLSHLSM